MNIISLWPNFIESIYQTFIMVLVSSLIGLSIGLVLGVALVVFQPGGIMVKPWLYFIIDKTTNFFRSIPFIILLALLIPVTRLLVGSAIGVKGAIVPLTFSVIPFFARQVESVLLSLNKGVIEAAIALGFTNFQIIKVYLSESLSGIIGATTITIISLIGLSTMAGAVGAGGIGDFTIRYGYQRSLEDVTIVCVLFLVVFISLIQKIGDLLAKRTSKT